MMFLRWWLDYAVHSTVILAVVAALSWRLGERRVRLQVRLWRTALVAGLVSASLTAGGWFTPALGELRLLPTRAEPVEAEPVPTPPTLRSTSVLPAAPSPSEAAPLDARHARPDLSMVSEQATPQSFSWAVLMGIALTAALTWWFVPAWRTRLFLRTRTPLEGPWAKQLAELVQSTKSLRQVTLSESASLTTPVAFGWLRPEICLPTAAREYAGDPRWMRAVLAHELGHLQSRDPLWMGALRALRCLAPWQPGHHYASRRLKRLSELAADEWAVGQTRDPLALARSLTDVAGWVLQRPCRAPLACSMVARHSALEQRVQRLLSGTGQPTSESGVSAWGPMALVFVPLLLPSLRRGEATPLPLPAPHVVDEDWNGLWLRSRELQADLHATWARLQDLPQPLRERAPAARAQRLLQRIEHIEQALAERATSPPPSLKREPETR